MISQSKLASITNALASYSWMISIGARVDAIEKKYHEVAKDINLEILSKWVNGSGKKPVTWKTLIDVLLEIGLTTLADDIKAVKL